MKHLWIMSERYIFNNGYIMMKNLTDVMVRILSDVSCLLLKLKNGFLLLWSVCLIYAVVFTNLFVNENNILVNRKKMVYKIHFITGYKILKAYYTSIYLRKDKRVRDVYAYFHFHILSTKFNLCFLFLFTTFLYKKII